MSRCGAGRQTTRHRRATLLPNLLFSPRDSRDFAGLLSREHEASGQQNMPLYFPRALSRLSLPRKHIFLRARCLSALILPRATRLAWHITKLRGKSGRTMPHIIEHNIARPPK